jgi:RimJ/RimL family protein N-acetyltransferase
MRLTPLETERLILRQIEETDAEGLHQAYGDPKAMRFWDFPATSNIAATAKCIRGSRAVALKWHGVWAIVPRAGEGGGRCIGIINYHHREVWNRRLELGWILARQYWLQGLMTEAAAAVLRHCFTKMKIHRIEAIIEPDNTASRALASKLGFAQEGGLLRDRLCVAGEYRDVLMYGLLQPDWARVVAEGSR